MVAKSGVWLRATAVSAVSAVCVAVAAWAADVQGVVVSVQGQRAVLLIDKREVAVSLPAGTTVRPGQKVRLTLEPVGDTLLTRNLSVLPS